MRRLGALLALVLVVGCKYGPEYRLPKRLSDRYPSPSDSYPSVNHVGFEILRSGPSTGGNVLVGPVTLTSFLATMASASSGPTHDGIVTLLATSDNDFESFTEKHRAILNQLSDKTNGAFQGGGAVWTIWPVILDRQFAESAASRFDVHVKKIGNTGLEAVRYVNKFAQESTNGRVTEIVEKLDREDQLFGAVTATVAFRTQAFSDAGTIQFEGVPTPAMRLLGKVPYYAEERFVAFRVPLDSSCVLTVVLPKPGKALKDVSSVLNESAWALLKSSMVETDAEITLPVMDVQCRTGLKGALSVTEAKGLFGQNNNFRRMAIEMEQNFRFKDVYSTVRLQIGAGGGPSVPKSTTFPLSLTVDRPFFAAVSEAQTGAILVMGQILTPLPPSPLE